MFDLSGVWTFLQVILLDVVLSGDNAVVIGALAASLVPEMRKRAILLGMGLALVFRVIFSLGAVRLLQFPGIMVLGGVMLLYIAYKLFRELTDDGSVDGSTEDARQRTFLSAMIGITLADLSMSIDNVLAVAGAASQHWEALVFGLVLSIALMAFAASIVAKLIARYSWLSWVGFVLILVIALRMIYHGVPTLLTYFHYSVPTFFTYFH